MSRDSSLPLFPATIDQNLIPRTELKEASANEHSERSRIGSQDTHVNGAQGGGIGIQFATHDSSECLSRRLTQFIARIRPCLSTFAGRFRSSNETGAIVCRNWDACQRFAAETRRDASRRRTLTLDPSRQPHGRRQVSQHFARRVIYRSLI
jgi:hypothetical protein